MKTYTITEIERTADQIAADLVHEFISAMRKNLTALEQREPAEVREAWNEFIGHNNTLSEISDSGRLYQRISAVFNQPLELPCRTVEIKSDSVPTAEQITAAFEKLGSNG